MLILKLIRSILLRQRYGTVFCCCLDVAWQWPGNGQKATKTIENGKVVIICNNKK